MDFPVTVTVKWDAGCNRISTRIEGGGWIWCGGTANPGVDSKQVVVGSPQNSPALLSLNSGLDDENVMTCSTATFWAWKYSSCSVELIWDINGETFITTGSTVSYFVSPSDCPVHVTVRERGECGESPPISRTFGCIDGPGIPPSIQYPKTICASNKPNDIPHPNPGNAGGNTTICVPGAITNIRKLNPTNNSLPVSYTPGSKCLTITVPAFCPATIMLEVSYEWCDRVVKEVLTIQVICCDLDGGMKRNESESEQENTVIDISDIDEDVILKLNPISNNVILGTKVTELDEAIILAPNPVSDFLTIDNVSSFERFEIYTLTGEFISRGDIDDSSVKINTQTLQSGMHLIVLQNAGEIETFKFIKQ